MNKDTLPSPWEFIRHSFEIYFKKDNLFYLTKINLFGILASFATLSPLFLMGFLGDEGPNLSGASYFVLVLIMVSVIASIVWAIWFQTTIIKAIALVMKGQIKGVKETFKLARPRVGNYFLTTLLAGLIIGVGLILLIIPGVIFLVWFAFANYIIVEEKIGVKDALRKSKALVKGYFWQVIGRSGVFVIFYILIQVVMSLVPFVGPLVLSLFSPYYILLPYLMYQALKEIKGGDTTSASVSEGAPL